MAIEVKDRTGFDPPDGYYVCEACGRYVYHDDALRDEDGCTYHRGCARECNCCDVVFPATELDKDGFCKACREDTDV